MIIRKQVVVEEAMIVCDLCDKAICHATKDVFPETAYRLSFGDNNISAEQHFCRDCGSHVYAVLTKKDFWKMAI